MAKWYLQYKRDWFEAMIPPTKVLKVKVKCLHGGTEQCLKPDTCPHSIPHTYEENICNDEECDHTSYVFGRGIETIVRHGCKCVPVQKKKYPSIHIDDKLFVL